MLKIRLKLLVKKITFFACLLLVLSGCAINSEEKTGGNTGGDDEKVLTFVNFRDIRDLNPHLYAGEMYAQGMLYETLVKITEKGYEPNLAESWDISDDGTVYTFKIREGVFFSDGEVCDAYAIKANFDAIIDNMERHTWLEMMNLLVSVEAEDETTFVITLSDPYYPMLTELGVTRPFAMISPNSMIEGTTKDGVEGYIGTGPYILTDFVTDEYAVFEKNENYWGEIPEIDKIVVKVISDNQTRMLALENEEIDLIYGKNMIDADAVSKYKEYEGIEVALSEPTSTRQILMNSTEGVFQDIEVRRAVQHAVDKSMISEGIFNGLEMPADFLFAKTVPYCDVNIEAFGYDLEKASHLLEEAGWQATDIGIREKEGEKLEFELLYNADSVTERTIGEYIQAELSKIGVLMTLKGEEEQSYRDNMKNGNFDMVFNISWGTPYDPQSSLSAMQRPVYGDYAAQLGLEHKEEIDEAISRIMVSTNEEERKELYTFVLMMLHEEAIYLPITYECNKAVFNDKVSGVEFSMSQYEVPFEKMYLTD